MTKNLLSEVQKDRNLSDHELAYLVRRSVRTIRNLKCGNSSSLALRQRVTNILRAEIWPDVQVTENVIVFRPGTDLELSPSSFADGWVHMFNKLQPGIAVRDGRIVRLNKPIAVTLEVAAPKHALAANNRKITTSSIE